VQGFVVGVVERDYETALDAIDRSLALSPSSALAFGFSSIIHAWLGDDTTAVAHAQTALRHGPYDPLIFLPYVGLAYTNFFSARFEQAISAASRALQANPRSRFPADASLARLGRTDEAAACARHLLELETGFTIGGLVASHFASPERLDMLADALRRAGLPE
jgi:adenylate cyclase